MTNEIILMNQTEIQMMNSLEDYATSFIDYLDSTPKTIESYKKNLKQFFLYLQEMEISLPKREDIISYRKHLKNSGYKETTIQAYINTTKQFFKWTSYAGIYEDIASGVKNEKVKNIHRKDSISEAEFEDIISLYAGREDIESLRNLSIILLEGTCGLRCIEIERSNIEDFKTISGTPVLMIQGKGHSSKDDFVKLTIPAEKIIRKYLALRTEKNSSDPLFISLSDRNQNQRLTTRSISRIIKNSLLECGINEERKTAHSLRHYFVNEQVKEGLPLTEIQANARHSDIRITMIYIDENKKLESKASDLFNRKLQGLI